MQLFLGPPIPIRPTGLQGAKSKYCLEQMPFQTCKGNIQVQTQYELTALFLHLAKAMVIICSVCPFPRLPWGHSLDAVKN